MKAVEDYEALANDPDVDIVYVSNIHPAHKDASILMVNHGKHVLCEKPLAVSPDSTGLVHSQCMYQCQGQDHRVACFHTKLHALPICTVASWVCSRLVHLTPC